MPRVSRATTIHTLTQRRAKGSIDEMLGINPWIVLFAVTLLAVGAILYANNKFYLQILNDSRLIAELRVPQDAKAWIELDFGAGHKRLFEGIVDRETYPFSSVLKVVAENHNFNVDIRKGKIASIDGVGKSSGTWRIYKQGALVLIPLDRLMIQGGDWYTLRYEK